MAVLRESGTWPIHSARRLHDKAQQGFLWQFYMTGVLPSLDEDMMMLAQSVTIPGITFAQKSYKVAGQEQHYLGPSTRGGPVMDRSAVFAAFSEAPPWHRHGAYFSSKMRAPSGADSPTR